MEVQLNTSELEKYHKYHFYMHCQVKWGTKHSLGSRAFADAMVLDNSVPTLIKHYFPMDDPRTDHFYHSFQEGFQCKVDTNHPSVA